MVPGPESEQTFTADTDNPEDATNVSGQTLQEYITTQIQVFGEQAFPGRPGNYVLSPIDSPEVEEGEPSEIPESETPCPVEEGMPTHLIVIEHNY